jgi:hypothetical protein
MFHRIPYRKSLLAVALILALIVIAYFLFGRVTLTSDLGTNGKVSVRFSAPSPWFSGRKYSLCLYSSEKDRKTDGTHCWVWEACRNDVPVTKQVNVRLDRRADTESTVADFIEAFESSVKDDDIAVPILLYGDPDTPIGRNFKNPQCIAYAPNWILFQIGEKNLWFPLLFSERDNHVESNPVNGKVRR